MKNFVVTLAIAALFAAPGFAETHNSKEEGCETKEIEEWQEENKPTVTRPEEGMQLASTQNATPVMQFIAETDNSKEEECETKDAEEWQEENKPTVTRPEEGMQLTSNQNITPVTQFILV